jgi:Iron only hydrogenase large subunit, C-terminal domain
MLLGPSGSSSGGYADFIFIFAAKQLFEIDLSATELSTGSTRLHIVPGKNQDSQETILYDITTTPPKLLLHFAKAYGFRNIQNLVRKITPKRTVRINKQLARKAEGTTLQFVEVMACPSGCVNGGGQLKVEGGAKWDTNGSSNSVTKQWLELTESVYASGDIKENPLENTRIAALYKYAIWLIINQK